MSTPVPTNSQLAANASKNPSFQVTPLDYVTTSADAITSASIGAAQKALLTGEDVGLNIMGTKIIFQKLFNHCLIRV